MEHNETNHTEGQVRPAVIIVLLSATAALITAIVGGTQINEYLDARHDAYIADWHLRHPPYNVYSRAEADKLFAHKSDIITLAEADSLKQGLHSATELAQSNAVKMDVLLLQSAEQTALAKEAKLDRIEANPQNTAEWREVRREAKADFDRAIAYRNCLRSRNGSGDDCDRLRGF